jgi:hypothetical protein
LADLLPDTKIENITKLLQTLGIVTTGVGVITGGVFGYLKWKNGRKVERVEPLKDSPIVIVKVEGNNNTIQINRDVWKLSENKQVLEGVEGALSPVEDRTSESIEFRENDKPMAAFRREEVKAIIASCEAAPDPIIVENEEVEPKTVTANLYAYGPVFDAKAPNWRFRYRNKPIYADVRETTIAKDAVTRGKSAMNDRYRVRMEVRPAAIEGGDTHYRIIDVLDFQPAEEQVPLPLRKPRTRTDAGSTRSKRLRSHRVFAVLLGEPPPILQGSIVEYPRNDRSPVLLKIESIGIGIPKEPSHRTGDHTRMLVRGVLQSTPP